MNDSGVSKANKKLTTILFVAAIGMFGFGYALVPLYDLLCDITGLNGKTARLEAKDVEKTTELSSRTVRVEFLGNASSGLPWEFRPLQSEIKVRLGQTVTVKYLARNSSQEIVTGQAIPSVAPGKAASHFKKIECFCFSQQTLQPGEEKEMPVQFVVDPRLAEEVDVITLNYAFFNTNKKQAQRFGGDGVDAPAEHQHDKHVSAHPMDGG